MAKKITPARAARSGSKRPGTQYLASNFAHLAQDGRKHACTVIRVLIVALLATANLPAQSTEAERQMRVFAPQTNYVVPIVEHNGTPYVGLFELLEPLGRVESRFDQQKWKLKFTAASSRSIEVEFTQGEVRGKLGGTGYDLPAEFVLLGGRGFVPVTALGGMLPRLLSQPVQLHPGGRLLIGGLGFSFSQQLRQKPAGLVLSFPSAVNPMIATEQGHIRLTFTHEPLVRPADGGAQKFSDPVFQSSSVAASNGALQLTVNVASPVTATFSDGNKTITLSPLPPAASAEAKPPAQSEAPPAVPPQMVATAAPLPPRPVVVIDAAHGGSDHGAMLAGNVPEKDLTLVLARLIQHDLEAHGVSTQMVRTVDNDLDADQRAAIANSARIIAYIAIHAAGEGHGVRLYTALLPASAQPPTHKKFLAWANAQSSWLDLSGSLAGSVAAELNQRNVVVHALASPLRPLNNIWAPAIGIEVTPPADEKDIKSGAYLHTVSAAVSAGIVAVRSKLEAAR